MTRTKRRLAALALACGVVCAPIVGDATAAVADQSGTSVDLGVPEADTSGAGLSTDDGGRVQAEAVKPRTTTMSSKAVGFYGVTPFRAVDTRAGSSLAAEQVLTVPLAGVAGIPGNASAVVVNVTVTRPAAEGFVSVYPCGAAYGTSTLNFVRNQTVANMSLVQLGEGAVCVTSSVRTDVVLDVAGYADLSGRLFSPVPPARIHDSRLAGGPQAAMVPTRIQVAGTGGVPASGAAAVALNLTIAGPRAEGYATVYPCNGEVPYVSNVNFTKYQEAAANSAVVALDADGGVCVLTSATADVIVDVTGWFGPTGTEVRAAAPTRLTDTRQTDVRASANAVLRVMAAPGALGAVLNVTVTGSSGAGYLTVWNCDEDRPPTSNANYGRGQTIANAVLGAVSDSGLVCISPSTSTHVIVDRTAVLGLAGSGDLTTTGSVATDWALTQIGSPYAAINPYRFGDSKYGKPWDCDGQATCTMKDMNGKDRTVAEGAYVYDCSGLVVAAWLRAGIDLVKQGASWTEPMLTKLPSVSRETAQVGDLLLFDFDHTDSDPVSHVGMYLSDSEMVHAGTCRGGVSEVCRTSINWSNVVAVKHPSA